MNPAEAVETKHDQVMMKRIVGGVRDALNLIILAGFGAKECHIEINPTAALTVSKDGCITVPIHSNIRPEDLPKVINSETLYHVGGCFGVTVETNATLSELYISHEYFCH